MTGNRVREIRLQKRLTCEALARKVEMASTDLSKLERGIRHPYPGWRKRIAQALQESEEYLFPGVGESGNG